MTYVKTNWSTGDTITAALADHWETQYDEAAADLIAKPASPAQGDILYYNGTTWVRLPAGTAGYLLKTQGSGANPAWTPPTDPWLVDINIFGAGHTNTGFTSLSESNPYRISTGAQNDEIGWDVILSAGTWTFELVHDTGPGRGIYTVSLDGNSKGTIDGYDVAGASAVSTIANIAVAVTGKTRLLVKMATKNASSASYQGMIRHIQLRRTA